MRPLSNLIGSLISCNENQRTAIPLTVNGCFEKSSNDDGSKFLFYSSIVMLDGRSPSAMNTFDELDLLPSLDDLSEFDMGKYTMKLLTGTDRLYKIKTDRSSRLLETMAKYREEERFCDVVLCVKDERIPAHKLVLVSASPYFASMFGQSAHIEARTTEDIDLTKLIHCPTVVRKIVDFIYTSQIELNDKLVKTTIERSLILFVFLSTLDYVSSHVFVTIVIR